MDGDHPSYYFPGNLELCSADGGYQLVSFFHLQLQQV